MNLLASPGQLRASLMRWALVCIPALVLLGFISGVAAQSGPDNPWFAALVKPPGYPPPQAFGVVWTILYVLMGLALAMVLSARGAVGRGPAVIAFGVQLVLNLAWSPVFFGAHQLTASVIVIVLLDIAAVAAAWLMRRVRPVAGLLLLPYIAWLLFATYLNAAILSANPQMDGAESSGAAVRYKI